MPRKPSSPSLSDSQSAPGGVAAIDRALSVLSAFRRADSALSVTELANRTRLYKSTVLRLLASLSHAGWMRKTSEGLWALGPQTVRLAAIYTASFSLEAVITPVMQALVKRVNESVAFHIRQGEQRVCLFRVDCTQAIRDHVRVGDVLPLDRGSGGRVLLAFSGASGELYDRIRKDGFVALIGDRTPGLAGISAPIWNHDHALVGALTLTVPESRYQPGLKDAVLEAAAALSAQL
jgi:DNA-binding IclR family transcriptional regulator